MMSEHFICESYIPQVTDPVIESLEQAEKILDEHVQVFKNVGIDISKYNLDDNQDNFKLFNDFLKAVKYDVTKIADFNKK
jgi:hypothetical protein